MEMNKRIIKEIKLNNIEAQNNILKKLEIEKI